jgi:hypothetical protein
VYSGYQSSSKDRCGADRAYRPARSRVLRRHMRVLAHLSYNIQITPARTIYTAHLSYNPRRTRVGCFVSRRYMRVLADPMQSCRCVELDCWDGTAVLLPHPFRSTAWRNARSRHPRAQPLNGGACGGGDGLSRRCGLRQIDSLGRPVPIIYHGHTLTTKVTFQAVCEAINTYGFVTSEYPVHPPSPLPHPPSSTRACAPVSHTHRKARSTGSVDLSRVGLPRSHSALLLCRSSSRSKCTAARSSRRALPRRRSIQHGARHVRASDNITPGRHMHVHCAVVGAPREYAVRDGGVGRAGAGAHGRDHAGGV